MKVEAARKVFWIKSTHPPLAKLLDAGYLSGDRLEGAVKPANSRAETSKLETDSDQLVYQLYGLTEDEIKIVEGKD